MVGLKVAVEDGDQCLPNDVVRPRQSWWPQLGEADQSEWRPGLQSAIVAFRLTTAADQPTMMWGQGQVPCE